MTYPWEYYAPVEEGNPHAGAHAAGWAAATFVVMLVVVLPREHAHTDAFMVGNLVLAPVVVAVVVWLVARKTSTRWGWWVFALVVPAATLALTVFTHAEDLVDYARGKTADGGTRADTGPVIHELSAPATQGDWTLVDDPQMLTQLEKRKAVIGTLVADDPDHVIAAAYTHRRPQAGVVLIALNEALDPSASLEKQAETILRGGRVEKVQALDPGAAEGYLGCGFGSGDDGDFIECAWIGNQRVVATQWFGVAALEDAGRLTVELRDLAAAGG